MHIITKVFSSVLMRSEVYSIELYVRTFVGYLWHVGGVFPVVSYFLHQSTDRQDITEIKLIARGVKYNNPLQNREENMHFQVGHSFIR